jgi:hypothetical protein
MPGGVNAASSEALIFTLVMDGELATVKSQPGIRVRILAPY